MIASTLAPEGRHVPAAMVRRDAHHLALGGNWTAFDVGRLGHEIDHLSADQSVTIDASGVTALDTVGAWMVERLLRRLRQQGVEPEMRGWNERHGALLALVSPHPGGRPASLTRRSLLERAGRASTAALAEGYALLKFIGQAAFAIVAALAHPAKLRWRTLLRDMQSAGFNALPIVGLLSLLLGVVVAYQAADQLRRYGASIFVVDLVGLSMLREFAPLMTAIIVAGRSGSAYTAEIGTMRVTEEIDAMRTLGIAPLDVLTVPKVIALAIVLPLLTVYAGVLGMLGGMIMANAKLGIGYGEFFDRLARAVDPTSYLIGIGKAPIFAAIIAVVGCFQGFRTRGGADAVGRQTTRSVVHSIFLVIVVDALFSIWFSVLGL